MVRQNGLGKLSSQPAGKDSLGEAGAAMYLRGWVSNRRLITVKYWLLLNTVTFLLTLSKIHGRHHVGKSHHLHM